MRGTKKFEFLKRALNTKDYPVNNILSETTDSYGRTKRGTCSTTKRAITITISSTALLMRKVIMVTITVPNKASSNQNWQLDPAATRTVLTRYPTEKQAEFRYVGQEV